MDTSKSVSYTHLDVYKRQALQLLLAGPDVDIREYRRVVDELSLIHI